jgi:hypothetical protein
LIAYCPAFGDARLIALKEKNVFAAENRPGNFEKRLEQPN